MKLAPQEPGTSLAPGYEALAHLSRGRRLDVYDAWDAGRGCRCIVKALRPDRRHEPHVRQALLFEGDLICELNHPHLVRGYEVLVDPEPLVVMETLGGQTLDHMIETEGPLGPGDIAQLGLQLGSALHYLHQNEVLHLDLKPSNVVAEAGRAKLIDFSVARPPGPAPSGIGTWCYLAPEQAEGGALGFEADVWGLGAVLFEAAVGSAPFDDGRPSESSGSRTHDGPWSQLERPAPLDELPGLPPELAGLISECLEPERTRRPTVREFVSRLGSVGAPQVD